MAATQKTKIPPHPQSIVCCLQGGGALGAYQVGVLRALDEKGYLPDWFVGTSIGAINAAIAAGNPEKVRIEKLYQFWEEIATSDIAHHLPLANDPESRKMAHLLSAHATLMFGQPGFFIPRFPPLVLGGYNSPDTISFYDTSPLKNTLERYIDFDRINSKATRLSVGAVEICSGEMMYFDSLKHKIGPEHIMASGALPPGFPAVEIDGKFYWDGGISSNAPTNYVLSTNHGPDNLLCFAIHLFDSYGLYPTSLDEVMKRKKDIEFSSRFAKSIQLYQQVHALKNCIHTLANFIPKEQRTDPEIQSCLTQGFQSTVSLVRFLYEQDESEFASKDYEFSKKSILERIENGYRDGKKATKKSPWLEPVSKTTGIVVHDMSPQKHLKESEHG